LWSWVQVPRQAFYILFFYFITSLVGRVVKATDLRSVGHSPRGFEPHTKHFSIYLYLCGAIG
jgi:hypothetical protein